MICQFDPNKRFIISKTVIENLKYTIPTNERRIHISSQKDIRTALKRVINPDDGIIDGDALRKAIFPVNSQKEPLYFDVFISHSHNDIESAKILAAYLRNKLGMSPFIDNYIWGSADGLLHEIDNDYCRISGMNSYNYDKRNFSTSHVHTMLSMAIMEMIARCKCFIFIESGASINLNILNSSGRKTQSPWLFQELQYVNMLSVSLSKAINESLIPKGMLGLKIEYSADTSDFKQLTAQQLKIKASRKQKLY